MPLIALAVGTALGTALVKVSEKIADKLVELCIEPTQAIARDKLLKGYDAAKAAQELRGMVMAALDKMRSETPDGFDRLKITNWVTGQSPETYELMAASAVEMVYLDPQKVPGKLLAALHLDASGRKLLALFLVYLRKKLAGAGSFGQLIAYADRLEERGSLAGLAQEVAIIAQDTHQIKSLMEQLTAGHGLTDDDARALEAYLGICRAHWSGLMLPLVRKNVERLTPNLKRVFVPLLVRDEKAEDEARKAAEKVQRRSLRTRLDEVQEQVQPVDFYTAFSKYKKFILLGLPGTGKTTLLRLAALAFAEGRASEDIGWQEGPRLPIFIRLRNFGIYLAENHAKFSAPGAGALVAYLEQNLRQDEGIDIPHDFFKRRLEAGGCVVLLDGLDEVVENRVEVAQDVNAFIDKYARFDNRIGLSSRPRGYEGDARLQLSGADLALLEVLPLPPAGIRHLIEKLLPLLEADPHQREEDAIHLEERILSNKNLTEIASVPLFCAALVQVYKYHGADLPQRRVDVLAEIVDYHGADLPQRRVDVLAKIVDLLLGFWYAQQTEIRDPEKLASADGTGSQFHETQESIDLKFNRLAHLAYAMQAEIGQVEIDAAEAQKRLAAYLKKHEDVLSEGEARRWARSFLRSAHEQSGLFVESSPGVYTFLHKSFMEFFAATSLLMDQEHPLEAIMTHLDDEWWEPVLLMAASHPKTTDPFRRQLIPAMLESAQDYKWDTSHWARRLMLAGQMARDMTTRLPAPQREEIVNYLYTAAIDPAIPPLDRASLADVLDQFWHPADLSTFIKVSSPQSTFYIGKYPVTNTQYERFLRPANFADPSLWTKFPEFSGPDSSGQVKPLGRSGEEGWNWLQEALQDNNNLVEAGVLYPRFWRDPRFGNSRSSAPVVGVSWWEANAYCQWLQAHWNELEEGKLGLPKPKQLRLPKEPEWVLAAGGEQPQYHCAWDAPGQTTTLSDEIIQRANVVESGINRTTPVWMYPLGATPDGVMDMNGNIGEWLANYGNLEQGGWYYMRGGSWVDYDSNAHVMDRKGAYRPLFRSFEFGFRVVSIL